MSKAKIQGNFYDEVDTQIKKKKHLQLAEEMFNSLCLTNKSYNEIFLIIILISKILIQKCPPFCVPYRTALQDEYSISAHFNAKILSFFIHQFSVTVVNHQLTEIQVSTGLKGEGGAIYQSHTMIQTIKHTSFHLQHQYYQYLLLYMGRKLFHSLWALVATTFLKP